MILAVAASALAAPTVKPSKSDDAKRIVGKWEQVAVSIRGEAKVESGGTTFTFHADRTSGMSDRTEAEAATYTIDPNAGTLTWTPVTAGRPVRRCAYRINDEGLTLAIVDEGFEVPKSLDPSGGLTIHYLKRVKR